MSNEPYRPGGEHCPKCGYRHDGRCNEKHRDFARWFAQKYEGTFDSRCQSDGDIARAYEARQPEIDRLQAQYDALAAEVREKLGLSLASDGMVVLYISDLESDDILDVPAIAKALKGGPSEQQEDEREGQMLAEQWREHERQTRP